MLRIGVFIRLCLLDHPGDDAKDGDFVVGFHGDGREAIVVFTTRAQHDAAGGSVNPLDAEFSIKETHRFTVVGGLNGLVDHQDVALVHARSWEGYSSHAEEECRRAVGNQRLRDVQLRGRGGVGILHNCKDTKRRISVVISVAFFERALTAAHSLYGHRATNI